MRNFTAPTVRLGETRPWGGCDFDRAQFACPHPSWYESCVKENATALPCSARSFRDVAYEVVDRFNFEQPEVFDGVLSSMLAVQPRFRNFRLLYFVQRRLIPEPILSPTDAIVSCTPSPRSDEQFSMFPLNGDRYSALRGHCTDLILGFSPTAGVIAGWTPTGFSAPFSGTASVEVIFA